MLFDVSLSGHEQTKLPIYGTPWVGFLCSGFAEARISIVEGGAGSRARRVVLFVVERGVWGSCRHGEDNKL